MKTLLMPSFGADMAKGMVAKWLVKPGDEVKKGDIIARIETMKGLIDMEVFDSGVIDSLLVSEGLEIPVGEAIAQMRLIDEMGQAVPATEATAQVASKEEPPPRQAEISAPVPLIPEPLAAAIDSIKSSVAEVPKISPAAKFRAQQLGIDWQKLGQGQGPEGAIVLADIEAIPAKNLEIDAGTAPLPSAPLSSIIEADEARLHMRQAIASVVSRSNQEIPHYYLESDICLDAANSWLSAYNSNLTADKRILNNALIFCAIARSLIKFPDFNGFYQQGRFVQASQVHLGNAISLRQGGLVVAAIHDAHLLDPQSMMVKLKDQVTRAREGGLRMSEMQDATITVSSLGDRGCDRMQSIIFPPQVAIIAIGRERTVPWVADEQVKVASVVSVSLAADHRVSDGHMGARLLNNINTLLQQPESLWKIKESI